MSSWKRLTKNFSPYIWILRFMRPYRMMLAGLAGCGILIGLGELTIPKMIGTIIDQVIPEKDAGLLNLLLWVLVVVIAVLLAAISARNLLERRLREFCSRDLQLQAFQHLRKLGFSYFENTPSGETLNLLRSDVAAVQELFRNHIPNMLTRGVFIALCIGLMASMSLVLTFLSLGAFLIYYTAGPILEKKTGLLRREASEHEKAYQKQIYDSVSAMAEIKAYGAENWIFQEVDYRYKTYSKSWLRMLAYLYRSESFRHFSHYAGAAILFVVGSFEIRYGRVQIGEFVTFLLYFFHLMGNMQALVGSITEQRLLMVQVNRLYQFSLQVPDVQESPSPIVLDRVRGEIVFENVSFAYRDGTPVLRDFSLTVHSGERVALVGESGSGKTTLLKLLTRFYDPQSGSIYLDGIPIRSLTLKQLREAIGYVFQETYLFGSSIRENILFGNPDADPSQVMDAARRAAAHSFISSLPEGYETWVGERGVKLSGGQKQRLSVARMLLKRPPIVLLDEATSALDREHELEIVHALNALKDTTIITVAHRLSTIRDYDRIVVMAQGKVMEIGNWNELMQKRGMLYELWKGSDEYEAG